jgi:hypothetical protein
MFRRALLSDTGLSLALHVLKSVVALLVNWLVLNHFALADFVTWTVTSSVLVVATVSDLGIGQYTTTRLIHAPREHWPLVLREATAALVPLAILAAVFVYIALNAQPEVYKVAMASAIGLRLLTIPAGALLNAVNQFKLRKAIEVGVYLAAAVVIAWITYVQASVLWALLVLNAAFLAGSGVTVFLGARHLGVMRHDQRGGLLAWGQLCALYRASLPYMLNNLTSLLTYGGFIWLCSFFLATDALARLSVLYTFILINAYQVYDVLLKSRQGDMIRADHVARMSRVNTALMVATPLLAILVGPIVLGWFAPRMSFSAAELILFALFLSLELGFLFVQSIIQVDPALASLLSRRSLVKFATQATAICAYGWVATSGAELTGFLATLVMASLIGYIVCSLRLGPRRCLQEAKADPW